MRNESVKRIKIALQKFMNLMSYSERQKRILASYHKEYDRYMAMSDDEFNVEYIETIATYERRKGMPGWAILILLVTAIVKIWDFFFELLTKLCMINQADNHYIIQTAECLSWFFIILSFLIVIMILYNLSHGMYELNRKRVLLEDLKKLRERNMYF